MDLSVVIMAAGQGTRMKSTTPKVLHKICGKEMLFHSIKEAKKLSNDISVVLFHQAEIVESTMNSYFDGITFCLQDHKNFPGTGGAVMAPKITKPRVLVLNGDMPLVMAQSMQKICEIEADVVMTAIKLTNPAGYGRVITDGESVVKIVEEKDATEAEKEIKTVNAGVYSFDSKLLAEYLPKLSNVNAQGEYYLTDLIELAVKDGKKVKWVEVAEDEFKGINSKIDLADAEELMLSRIRKSWMAAGVTMRLPSSIYIDYDASFVGECEVESHVVIKGKSVITNSIIKAGSVLEDALMTNSDCGPMARLRPKTEITNTHVGNFVECKNARLNGVKAGHLSYLGDCEADEGTNIGAGTITCNYDGAKKHQTKIGKNVFIGSDTQLVAPVTLADNTMIAAGTTVTKDVSSGSLAISRVPQKEIAGFFKKFFG